MNWFPAHCSALRLYTPTPIIHLQSSSHVKPPPWKRPTPVTCSISTLHILPQCSCSTSVLHPTVGQLHLWPVCPSSSWRIISYQLQTPPPGPALNASAPAQRSTARHNWGRYCSPMAVILHCIHNPPSAPNFPPRVPPVRCRMPYRYPKTHSPGQEDPTLANNLQKCVLSL